MDLRGGDEFTLVFCFIILYLGRLLCYGSLRLKPFLSATWWYQTICVPLGGLGGGASGWSVYGVCMWRGAEEGRGFNFLFYVNIFKGRISLYIALAIYYGPAAV